MTRKELCEKYGLSESNVAKNFNRCVKTIENKYGITIAKRGRGDNTDYYEITETTAIAKGIEFIKGVHQELVMDQEAFTGLIDWDFMVFLGVLTCPMFVFRGTYKSFLDYVGVTNKTNEVVERLKDSINSLVERGYIKYVEDHSTDEGYFNMWIIRKAEVSMKIGIDMIQRCMKLQKENNMRSWVPLLKTWVGLQIIVFDKDRQDISRGEEAIITLDELRSITGINNNMLSKCKMILEKDNLFKSSRAYSRIYKEKKYTCLGSKIELNGTEYDYTKLLSKV